MHITFNQSIIGVNQKTKKKKIRTKKNTLNINIHTHFIAVYFIKKFK